VPIGTTFLVAVPSWAVQEVPAGSPAADTTGMRISHAATALAAFTAGLTTAATLRRLTGARLPVTAPVPTDDLPPAVEHDAVVLPFPRPVVAAPALQPLESPARCGDSGGRTKAGAPCGARTSTGGRCHHHALAA
jgi:hypothetical protein